MASSDVNAERKIQREICRRKLAEHLRSQLSIVVNAADVRIITQPNDLYNWEAMPAKQYLLQKHLSKQSTHGFRELSSEVGRSVWAIHKARQHDGAATQSQEHGFSESDPASLNSMIAKLRSENVSLSCDNALLKQEAKKRVEEIASVRRVVESLEIQIKQYADENLLLMGNRDELFSLLIQLGTTIFQSMNTFKTEVQQKLLNAKMLYESVRKSNDSEEQQEGMEDYL